ncbi:MAG: baseplate J/gp47 family protein [Elainella sp. Prado103]|nr:baseplate J/gp47 family protein [Elainella sp. Prado103]
MTNTPLLDNRNDQAIVQDLLTRIPAYVPGWTLAGEGAGWAMVQIYARYLKALGECLNQSVNKNKLAFLEQLGINLLPAQAGRAPLVFQPIANLGDSRIPAATRVGAKLPNSSQPLIFETEQAIALTAAQLVKVVSLDPGRDGYADHSSDLQTQQPFTLFSHLQPTPHELYLAHDTVLALAGQCTVEVEFDLITPASQPLKIAWEYWDGKVWRAFKEFQQQDISNESFDATDGLTRNGTIRLAADCANTEKTTVNGIEAYWIRGRLMQLLQPDLSNQLAQASSIRLRTVIDKQTRWLQSVKRLASASTASVKGVVRDASGEALSAMVLFVRQSAADLYPGREQITQSDGSYLFPSPQSNTIDGFSINATYQFSIAGESTPVFNGQLAIAAESLQMNFTLQRGAVLDSAFSDGLKLDLSQTMYPFGKQPQPGSTFYLQSKEAFSKLGAEVKLYAQTTDESFAGVPGTGSNQILEPVLVPEYWNGQQWRILAAIQSIPDSSVFSTFFRTRISIFQFKVPEDWQPTTVNGQEGWWMRLRLKSGGFGVKRTLRWSTGTPETNNEITFVETIPPAWFPPHLGYLYRSPWSQPQHCLTYNDFQYLDRSEDLRSPGRSVTLYTPVSDYTPALYLGFDHPLPVDQISLYLAIQEKEGESRGPLMLWEYWDGASWQSLSVSDETANLCLPGMLAFIGPAESPALKRFDGECYWVRGRLREDGTPRQSPFWSVDLNAVWAKQVQTFTDEIVGSSTEQPRQTFFLRQPPVLPGQVVEVRELQGARAAVELPILREKLQQQGLSDADIRTVTDPRTGKVNQVWVRWQERPNFFFSSGGDRHYLIERSRGRLIFGDNQHGRVPAAGVDNIQVRLYQSGGGLLSNVSANMINQLLSGVLAQKVSNPWAAEGGADGESEQSVLNRGSQNLRHRRQAITLTDYEALAREASPAVAVARALPTTHPSGRPAAGWIKLIIMPHSQDAQPQPSFELRRQVRQFLQRRSPAAIAQQIFVTGPDYLPIGVAAVIAPLHPETAGVVAEQVEQTLAYFLHPLMGGPESAGWAFGRDVYLSDVAAILERVPGVDYVSELSLLLDNAPQGEVVPVPIDRIVVAGRLRIRLTAAERI